MKLKSIRMNADRHARLKEHAKAAGFKTMATYLESLLASPVARQGVPEEDIEREVGRRLAERLTEPEVARLIDLEVAERVKVGAPKTLPIEDCARALIDKLPEATRDLAYEICESVLHIQPSQLIYGHLMAVADAGRLQAPQIDPSWETNVAKVDDGLSTCEWPDCRKSFTPVRYGQRYCSNICGGRAATAALPPPAGKTLPILEAPGMQSLVAV